MSIQPIDLPSLLGAVTWPLIIVIAFTVFRLPLADLIKILGQRIHKFSVGGMSLELAEVSEIKSPHSLETEIRQLDAGMVPQSGASGISSLITELQSRGSNEYIVIDLGSEASPRWLTSRLYLLALMLTLLDRPLCIVFVETIGSVRKRFVGTASPGRIRWALARRYVWLETAGAAAYASIGQFQPDPKTGYFSEWQITQLMQQFLTTIRLQVPAGGIPPADAAEWVTLPNLIYEHAKWLDAARIERLLGNDLNGSYAVLLPNKTMNDLADPVLSQQGHFVSVVDADRSFRCLVDRLAVLESLATRFLRERKQAKQFRASQSNEESD